MLGFFMLFKIFLDTKKTFINNANLSIFLENVNYYLMKRFSKLGVGFREETTKVILCPSDMDTFYDMAEVSQKFA